MLLYKNIIKDDNPDLRRISAPVDLPLSEEDKTTLLSMYEYLVNGYDEAFVEKYKIRPGVGIAAPQIDVLKQMFAILAYDEKGEEQIQSIPKENLPPIGGNLHECNECGLQCGGGRSSFNIDWKGNMYPCNQLNMVESFPLQSSFSDAWKQINQAVEAWPRVPECEGCAYASVCTKCAARMIQYVNPGKQPVPMCEETRYLVQHGAWHIPDCDK